jgi:transposase
LRRQALRPNLRVVQEKSQDQLDLQACHRVRSRLVSRRTATINQIRAFPIEQGIAVRAGLRALRKSLFVILENRKDEISPRMAKLILGLYEDWCHLGARIEAVTAEIEELSHAEPKCQRLMSVPGIGPLISTALVAAIGSGEAFDRGRDLGAWLGLVPRQYSTGGRSILGRISKRGSRYLRTLLIQAARVLLMRPTKRDAMAVHRDADRPGGAVDRRRDALPRRLRRPVRALLAAGMADACSPCQRILRQPDAVVLQIRPDRFIAARLRNEPAREGGLAIETCH